MARCAHVVGIVAAALVGLPYQIYASPQRGLLQQAREHNPEQDVNAIEKDRDLHGVVLKLNDRIFDGNVLTQSDYSTDHWMVYWCPNWYEPCKALVEKYAPLSTHWQGKLNTQSLLRLSVRFAKVDCATDKPLCNKMGVEDYPTVQHYHKGKRVGTFVGRAKDMKTVFSKLEAWLEEELGGIRQQQHQQEVQAAEPSAMQYIVPGDRAFDVFLVVLIISVNFWLVTRNPNLQQKANLSCKFASASPAAEVDVACPSKAEDQEQHAESVTGMASLEESLMPQEWLRHRTSVNSLEL